MKSLFVPRKSEYYEAFARGDKNTEFRPYGPRWNEKTCPAGRRVVLSKGYGPKSRLNGVIISAAISEPSQGFLAIYGADRPCFAIRIDVDR